MNVTHVVLELTMGGLERVVLNLTRDGLRLGQRVSVVVLEKVGALSEEVRAMGVPVRFLGVQPGLRLSTIATIRRALDELQPDVVHTHQVKGLLYGGAAARRAGVPVVVHTEHGKHFDDRARTRWLGRLTSRYADRFCCVSDDIARASVAHKVVPQRKVVVVPNGIETARFGHGRHAVETRNRFGIPLDAPVIGTCGNLREVKRQDLLIRGFARLAGAAHPAHLLIVGDGELRGDLEALARELGVADRVHFAGFQSDPAPFMEAMNVFTMTSRSEGMPLAVLEAWASGLPVVASRVGGLPGMIDDGRTGLLFESGNDAELASKLAELLADPDRARQMGRTAREHVRARFDVSVMAESYHRLYGELLTQAAAPVRR